MNKIKTVLDREPLSSEFIQSKQEFGKVLSGAKVSNPGFWKTSWFYGVVGTASIVLTVTVISLDSISKATPAGNNPPIQDQIIVSNSKASPNETQAVEEQPVAEEVTEIDNSEVIENSELLRVEVAEIPVVAEIEAEENTNEIVEAPVTDPEPEPERRVYNSMFPHFGDVYTNEITVDQLCGSKLLCNDEWAVLSFKVQFYNHSRSIEQHIKGNQIPYDFCELFPESGSFSLFVTNIMAENRSTGKMTQLTSMNLKATN